MFGFRVPDIAAVLRVDQAWGLAGISAVLHDASGAYFGTPNVVNNGHPSDKFGWAVAAGAKFNLPGGDAAGFNICYAEGASGRCTNEASSKSTTTATRSALAGSRTACSGRGTEIELTRVWSALAFYEHIWNPKWRTSWFGGYVNVDYGGAATNLINGSFGGGQVCRPVAAYRTYLVQSRLRSLSFTPLVGNSCSPDYSFFEVGSRTQWNPVAQLDIGLEVLYTRHNTAFKGPTNFVANGSRPACTSTAFLGCSFDDQEVWSAMFRWQRNFYP